MFDKLVESDTAGAEFKNRSRYFMVSTIVVGILFLTAVVYSLYAAEIGLSSGNFEVAELIAPVSPDAPEHRSPQPVTASDKTSPGPRNVDSDIARVDEPTIMPTAVSSSQNNSPSRGIEKFNSLLPPSIGSGGPSNGPGVYGQTGTTSNSNAGEEPDESAPSASEPPLISKPKPPSIIKISRLLNGSAISLPKPPYPRLAGAVSLEGVVSVQVVIDEQGKVISAKAVDGHPFFRGVSEAAARNARFNPTILNDEPVRVTGVIVYRFKRS